MKKAIFTGACTALITPMRNGKIDRKSIDKLIEFQLSAGISAILVSGTTGESAVLSYSEHKKLIEHAAKRINGRIPLIAGTGSNDTKKAVKMSCYAAEYGANAVLVVTPYYNKANQNGIVRHYCEIADKSPAPVIVYNVPGRTAVNILPETYRELAAHPNICGIKEASANISDTALTAALCPELPLYCGNDDMLIPMLSIGACGIISVMSNIFPAVTSEICNLSLTGETKKALELYKKYLRFSRLIFTDINPIPIKHILAREGFCKNELRLPLTALSPEKAEMLEAEYHALKST